MSNVPSQDETGRTGSHGECSAAERDDALEEAAALAVELRARLALLAPPVGLWPGWDERSVLELGLAGIATLRHAVPELAGVHPWAECEARNETGRVDRRALAAVRTLERLAHTGREGLPQAVQR